MTNRELPDDETETVELRVNLGDVLQAAFNRDDFVQALLTRTLKNNLLALESLRASIERAQRKDIRDVRDFGDTMAASLFVGVESDIDYEDLLDLIDEYELGLAQRQVAGLAALY